MRVPAARSAPNEGVPPVPSTAVTLSRGFKGGKIGMIVALGVGGAAPFTLGSAPGARGQDVQERTLSEPTARFDHAFTHVASVRELPDGRVIAVDPSEVAVMIVDPAKPGATSIGRRGSGPGEYLFPVGLLVFLADTTVLVDRGNSRLLKITPSGELADGFTDGPFGAGRGSGSLPTASDTMGSLYAQGRSTNLSGGRMESKDSVPIERWAIGTNRLDTAAFVSTERYPRDPISGPRLPFSTTTLWTVAGDGRIAIVDPDPYQVTLIQRSGERRQGPVIRYGRVRLTEGHKEQWRETQSEPGPVASVVRGRSGVTWSMMRLPPNEPRTWPRYLPPFQSTASFATDGTLWVQRTTPAGEPPLFDVFDEACRMIGRVRLPAGARLVGFGRESVFLVRRDETDLEYVERFALPQYEPGYAHSFPK